MNFDVDDWERLVEPVEAGGFSGVRLPIKLVPGASRSETAGLLGDRLKAAAAAPPEGGRANKAVCELLAGVLGVPKRVVAVVAGPIRPRKTVEVIGIGHAAAVKRRIDALG